MWNPNQTATFRTDGRLYEVRDDHMYALIHVNPWNQVILYDPVGRDILINPDKFYELTEYVDSGE